MIDKKKIEEAASELYNSNAIFRRYEQAEIGFKAGINWFLENLWHDASEEPKEHKSILLQWKENGGYYVAFFYDMNFQLNDTCAEYTSYLSKDEVTHWLYIEDLMKGGK